MPAGGRALASAGAAPVVVAMLVMVLWGATPIVTRLALDDLEPLIIATLRTVIGGLLAIALLARARQPLPRDVGSRRLLAISAASGFVVFPVVFTIGQHRTSALHGVMILAALPIFTGLYAALVARRIPAREWLLGCSVALAGEALLIGARGSSAGEATLVGDLLVLGAALAVSAGYVAGAMLPARGLSSSATTFWGVLLGAVVLLPLLGGVLIWHGVPHAGATAWTSVAFLAVVTSIVGYVGWYWALARGGIARIATLQFLQPLSGFVLAVLVLGEDFTLVSVIAGIAIVCGVLIAQRA